MSMLSPNGEEGGVDAVVLLVIGFMATAARMAADPPKTLFRTIWLLIGGLGLATGGWVIGKAFGLQGWSAMACAWVSGALGSETLLPIIQRWLEARAGQRPRE